MPDAYTPRRHPSLVLVLILGFVAAVLTLALMYENDFLSGRNAAPARASGAHLFSFHDNGVSWYELDGSNAKPIPTPTLSIAEGAATNALEPEDILESAAEGPDGIVAYTTMNPAASARAEDSKSSIVPGEAKNPGWAYALTVSDASVGSSASRFTVAGYGAAFTTDGSLIALSPEGVSVYNLADGTRMPIIPMRGANVPGFALASDATYAAVPNPLTHALDIFSISASGSSASYLGTIPVEPLAAAFTGDGRLIVKTSDTAAAAYAITSSGPVPKGSITLESALP